MQEVSVDFYHLENTFVAGLQLWNEESLSEECVHAESEADLDHDQHVYDTF